MALFDVWVMIAAGLFGFFMMRRGFQMVPLLIGIILGPMFEDSLRVSIQWLNGDFTLILIRPIVLIILVLIPLFVVFTKWVGKKSLRSE